MYLKYNELSYEQKCEVKELLDWKQKQPEPTPENIDGLLRKLMNCAKCSNTMWNSFKRRRPDYMDDWFEDRGKKLYDWLTVRHVEKHVMKALYDRYGVGNQFNLFSGYKTICQAKIPLTKRKYQRNMINILNHGFMTRVVNVLDKKKKNARQEQTIIINPIIVRYLKHQEEALKKPYEMYKQTPLQYLQFFFRNPHRFEMKYGRKMDHREDEKLKKLLEDDATS